MKSRIIYGVEVINRVNHGGMEHDLCTLDSCWSTVDHALNFIEMTCNVKPGEVDIRKEAYEAEKRDETNRWCITAECEVGSDPNETHRYVRLFKTVFCG